MLYEHHPGIPVLDGERRHVQALDIQSCSGGSSYSWYSKCGKYSL
jgi:hypothetical protein